MADCDVHSKLLESRCRAYITRQGMEARLAVATLAGECLGVICEPVGCCGCRWQLTPLGAWLVHSDDPNCYVYRSGRSYKLALRRDSQPGLVLSVNQKLLPRYLRRLRHI